MRKIEKRDPHGPNNHDWAFREIAAAAAMVERGPYRRVVLCNIGDITEVANRCSDILTAGIVVEPIRRVDGGYDLSVCQADQPGRSSCA